MTLLLALAVSMMLVTGAWAIPYSATKIIIEVNSTDGDAGIQIFLDGEGWSELEITDPNGAEILDIEAEGSIGMQGITELFFESAEPSFDEQSLEELFELFPEGKYRFRGETVDGQPLKGKATLTHAIPAGPIILSPEEGEVVDPGDVVIFWDPITDPLPGTWVPVDIAGYQVIVEREEPTVLVFRVDLPATAAQVTVPWEFLEAGTTYKVEVLAIEESGNQTITESEFETP
ncbi:MAG: hypothetical protein JSV70_00830 [bacterium]|nr:MAG: hypothetical protein JSV70_00830 [bacterium]